MWDLIIIAIIRKVNYDGLTLFCGYNVKCHVYSNCDCYFLVRFVFMLEHLQGHLCFLKQILTGQRYLQLTFLATGAWFVKTIDLE